MIPHSALSRAPQVLTSPSLLLSPFSRLALEVKHRFFVWFILLQVICLYQFCPCSLQCDHVDAWMERRVLICLSLVRVSPCRPTSATWTQPSQNSIYDGSTWKVYFALLMFVNFEIVVDGVFDIICHLVMMLWWCDSAFSWPTVMTKSPLSISWTLLLNTWRLYFFL